MKKRGIEMSIARGFGSFASAQSISAGQFDCGLCAAPALTLSVAKGLPLIALATTDYDATMGVGVLADSPIRKPQDLAGKKIASVPTSAEFPFFPAYAKKVGLDIGTIEPVHVDNKVLERVLMEKQVDAVSAFATSTIPSLSPLGTEVRFMLFRDAGIEFYGQSLTTQPQRLEKDPGLCAAFVEGAMQAASTHVSLEVLERSAEKGMARYRFRIRW